MPQPISFTQQVAAYKQAIDKDIASYAQYAADVARSQFGGYAGLEVDAFLDILTRGGKRIRGALVMHGYAMCGGRNTDMIIQAARAIEMLHAYMLILDDIQDRATLRRGKAPAHVVLAEYHHRHGLKGDAEYAGISLAINAAIAGGHAALSIMANLDADPQLKLNALSITNRTLMITAHGQTYDVMNELVTAPEPADVERIMEWKSALYSFINPLHVGMVLAGAGCRDTDAITPYALHTGKAFQITDDILGVFGDVAELGKSPMDDTREGKWTLLTMFALTHAAPRDAAFLRRMLGNQKLSPEQFTRCRDIMRESGALENAQALAAQELAAAHASLEVGDELWPAAAVQFLHDLATNMTTRTK